MATDALHEVTVNGVRYFQADDVERWHRGMLAKAEEWDALSERAERAEALVALCAADTTAADLAQDIEFLKASLERIKENAQAWHGPEGIGSGHARALEVIAVTVSDALRCYEPDPADEQGIGDTE